jgi:hypothetical protein
MRWDTTLDETGNLSPLITLLGRTLCRLGGLTATVRLCPFLAKGRIITGKRQPTAAGWGV